MFLKAVAPFSREAPRFLALWALGLLVAWGCSAPSSPGPSPGAPSGPAPQSGSSSREPEKINIAYGALYTGSTPLWIAYEKGLYQKYGLDPEMFPLGSGETVNKAIIAGQVDVGTIPGSSALLAAAEGADSIIIATFVNRLAFHIYAVPSITRPEQLKGARIGAASRGSSVDFGIRWYLKKMGLDPEQDVTFIAIANAGERVAGLESGSLQAAALSEPASIRARQGGYRELVDLAKTELEYQYASIATRRAWVREHPEAATGFLKALIEGIHLYMTDKTLAMQVLGKYTKTDDQEILSESYDIWKDYISIVPNSTRGGFQTAIDQYAPENPKVKNVNPDEFMDNSFVKKIEDSGFMRQLQSQR